MPLNALLLGVIAVLGLASVRVLYAAKDVVHRLWRGPDRLRPTLGESCSASCRLARVILNVTPNGLE